MELYSAILKGTPNLVGLDVDLVRTSKCAHATSLFYHFPQHEPTSPPQMSSFALIVPEDGNLLSPYLGAYFVANSFETLLTSLSLEGVKGDDNGVGIMSGIAKMRCLAELKLVDCDCIA